MAKLEKRIKSYRESQVIKLRKQNEKLLRDLEEMNIKVLQARHIYEQSREFS